MLPNTASDIWETDTDQPVTMTTGMVEQISYGGKRVPFLNENLEYRWNKYLVSISLPK